MKLYVVATPIGNLEDITLRALRVLKEVDFILSEDTRVTKKLLNHYEIKTPTLSFHEHSDEAKYQKILEILLEGSDLALVTDAGTPNISDPGSRLIDFLNKKRQANKLSDDENQADNNQLFDLEIIPIPGPSALVTAISSSPIHSNSFYFAGFIPKKKGKQTFLKSLPEISDKFGAVIFFESGHRILKTMEGIKEFYPEATITLAKELTKIHEKILTGNCDKIVEFLLEKDHQKGEFVVIVE